MYSSFSFPSTEVLRTNYEKPVPFRNKYYFSKLVPSPASTAQKAVTPDKPVVPSETPKPIDLTKPRETTSKSTKPVRATSHKPIDLTKPPETTRLSRSMKRARKPVVVPSPASTAQKAVPPDKPVVPSETPKPIDNNNNSSVDDFIINKPPAKKQKVITTKKRRTSASVTRSRKILTRAAAAQGQKKVSDYFFDQLFVDPDDSANTNFLPDLVQRKVEVIVVDSDSDDFCTCTPSPEVNIIDPNDSGPVFVSSPASHTQIFEHPSLSPVNNENNNDSIVIVDSTDTN